MFGEGPVTVGEVAMGEVVAVEGVNGLIVGAELAGGESGLIWEITRRTMRRRKGSLRRHGLSLR